ncbi:SDR family oxidoreductase [bacterium]|nr:SDR family oxidoreductase [bacterium]
MASPRLDGKVAIVTGAGSQNTGIGNGRAAAILFAREGARVLLADRRAEAAHETLETIRGEGGEAEVYVGDVTVESDCEAMVRAATDRWGRLDILDNNVGIGFRHTIPESPLEEWERILRVNITGMMLASKHAIPAMVANGGGSIINISSIAAMRPRGLAAYATTKGAVISFTRALAADHGREGIRANCIAPGPVYTPMVANAGMRDEVRERRRRSSALGIEGTGWDVGYAALFLASDEGRYISGVVLPVDGGVLVR